MNAANKITMLRVFLIPVFLFIYLAGPFGSPASELTAFIVFSAASLTDFLDGYIARKWNLITNFGKLMDPLADKLLVSAALIAFVGRGALPAWVVIILISREFFISGFRLLALEQGRVLAASAWAKAKTMTQMAMVVIVLLQPLAENTGDGTGIYNGLTAVFIYASVILSIASAVEYAVKNRDAFKNF